jgi:predicted RNase H-like nuclease (RuvC/YqgF family)
LQSAWVNALLALTGEISEKMQLSNLKGKEIDIKDEKILRLERNIQDLTQKHSELSQLHQSCHSLQQDQRNFNL